MQHGDRTNLALLIEQLREKDRYASRAKLAENRANITFLQKMKEHDSDIEVIVITGYATIETSHEADALGAYQFVAKPFKIKDIVKLVTKSSKL